MKRYFSSEEEVEQQMVKVEAVKRGTISGRYGIFHFDPKGRDPLAKRRTVRVEVANEAVAKGYAKVAGRGSQRTTGNTVDQGLGPVAASRRETSITKDGEDTQVSRFFGGGAADTRDSTAFAADPSKVIRTDVRTVARGGHDLRAQLLDQVDDEDDGAGKIGDDLDDGDDDAEDGDGQVDDEGMIDNSGFGDDGIGQEGNANGGDAPGDDDDDDDADRGPISDHAGSDAGAGGDATDDTGAPTDATDDGTKVTAAPAPRRGSRRTPATPGA